MPKTTLDAGFEAPEINSFGHSFRLVSFLLSFSIFFSSGKMIFFTKEFHITYAILEGIIMQKAKDRKLWRNSIA